MAKPCPQQVAEAFELHSQQQERHVQDQVGDGQRDAAVHQFFGELADDNGQTGEATGDEACRVEDGRYGEGHQGSSDGDEQNVPQFHFSGYSHFFNSLSI